MKNKWGLEWIVETIVYYQIVLEEIKIYLILSLKKLFDIPIR